MGREKKVLKKLTMVCIQKNQLLNTQHRLATINLDITIFTLCKCFFISLDLAG